MHMVVRIVLVRIDTVVLKDIDTSRPKPIDQCPPQSLRLDPDCLQRRRIKIKHCGEVPVGNNQNCPSLVLSTIYQRRHQRTSMEKCAVACASDVLAEATGRDGWQSNWHGIPSSNAPHERRGHSRLSLALYGSRVRSMRLLYGALHVSGHCIYLSNQPLRNTHVTAEKAYPHTRLRIMSPAVPRSARPETPELGQIIGMKMRHSTVANATVPLRTYLDLELVIAGFDLCPALRDARTPRSLYCHGKSRITLRMSAANAHAPIVVPCLQAALDAVVRRIYLESAPPTIPSTMIAATTIVLVTYIGDVHGKCAIDPTP